MLSEKNSEPFKPRSLRLWGVRPLQRATWNALIVGGCCGLGWALGLRLVPDQILVRVVSGALAAAALSRIGQMLRLGFPDGVGSASWSMVVGCGIGVGVGMLLRRDTHISQEGALLGGLLGFHCGQIRWWLKEWTMQRLHHVMISPVHEWPEYRNKEFHFSMRYPPGWVDITSASAARIGGIVGENRLVANLASPDGRLNLNIVAGSYHAPQSAEDYLADVRKVVHENVSLGSRSFVETVCGVSSLPPGLSSSGVPFAAEALYTRQMGGRGGLRRFKKLSFPSGDLEFVLTYGAPPRQFSSHLPLIDRCLETTRLGDP
jgi:hypothetical protein